MKKTEKDYLREVIKLFLEATESNVDNAEKAVSSYSDFYDFVEEHGKLQDAMYEFFHKFLDNYVLFKFYTSPIPALVENEDYMNEYRQGVLKQAKNFFNFGGIVDENVQQ